MKTKRKSRMRKRSINTKAARQTETTKKGRTRKTERTKNRVPRKTETQRTDCRRSTKTKANGMNKYDKTVRQNRMERALERRIKKN